MKTFWAVIVTLNGFVGLTLCGLGVVRGFDGLAKERFKPLRDLLCVQIGLCVLFGLGITWGLIEALP